MDGQVLFEGFKTGAVQVEGGEQGECWGKLAVMHDAVKIDLDGFSGESFNGDSFSDDAVGAGRVFVLHGDRFDNKVTSGMLDDVAAMGARVEAEAAETSRGRGNKVDVKGKQVGCIFAMWGFAVDVHGVVGEGVWVVCG